jgi:hypothetical protein
LGGKTKGRNILAIKQAYTEGDTAGTSGGNSASAGAEKSTPFWWEALIRGREHIFELEDKKDSKKDDDSSSKKSASKQSNNNNPFAGQLQEDLDLHPEPEPISPLKQMIVAFDPSNKRSLGMSGSGSSESLYGLTSLCLSFGRPPGLDLVNAGCVAFDEAFGWVGASEMLFLDTKTTGIEGLWLLNSREVFPEVVRESERRVFMGSCVDNVDNCI